MTVPLIFEEISPEALAYLSNGCGPKAWGVKVPNLVFHENCDRHDFDYWSGFTQADRYRADRRFLDVMLESANQITGWFARTRRVWYRFWAWRYYWAVRALGWKVFQFDRSHYGTLEDLIQEMTQQTST